MEVGRAGRERKKERKKERKASSLSQNSFTLNIFEDKSENNKFCWNCAHQYEDCQNRDGQC